MEGSVGNDNSQDLQGEYSPNNSGMNTGKEDKSKRSNSKGPARSKRRSKNDRQGRDYECDMCDKKYLSYPALYTHKKQKHSTPDASTPKNAAPINRRGRPPKNENITPLTERYFEAEDKRVGDTPSDLEDWYKIALSEFQTKNMTLDSKLFGLQLEYNENPLYKAIQHIINMDTSILSQSNKEEKVADDAFALYLRYCSEKVNEEFLIDIWKFIIFYREAFNQYGPEKYNSDDPNSKWEKQFYERLHKKYFDKSFSDLAPTEFLPDVANELFIFFQLQYNKMDITKDIIKDLTLNFTYWLHKCGLTTARVIV
jgi:hypothetical protein